MQKFSGPRSGCAAPAFQAVYCRSGFSDRDRSQYPAIFDLERTQLTDAGLAHLKGLTELRQFDLTGTQVTPRGVQELQQSFPNAQIIR